MKVTLMKQEDIAKMAAWIAECNRQAEDHIGYCGTDPDNIREYLQDLHAEAEMEHLFAAAWEEDRLIGILGFDPDRERGVAEIWGPFVRSGQWFPVADALWTVMLSILPSGITGLHLFCNARNTRCAQFAALHGFRQRSEECILTLHSTGPVRDPQNPVENWQPEYYEGFVRLHDEIFPRTYRTGAEIVRLLDSRHAVFVLTEGAEPAGYIFVECEPEYREGSIEFIGVAPACRGRGYGTDLLLAGVRYMRQRGVEELRLCVNADNQAAIRMYKKAGFTDTHYMRFFVREGLHQSERTGEMS